MDIKKCITLVCLTLILFGCSGMQNQTNKNQDLTQQIKVGMDEGQVKEIAGPPDIEDRWGKGKFIYYYKTQTSSKGETERSMAMPVFFEKNRVFAVGWEMKQKLDKQNQELKQRGLLKKKEKMLYEKVKKIPAADYKSNYQIYNQLAELNPESQLYRKKRDYYKTEYQKRKDVEQKLYNKVKKIPASDYKGNYDIYLKLTQIDPSNELYRKKRDYYKARIKKGKTSANTYENAVETQSCYIIGYRYGRCSAKTEKGLKCEQRNKVTIPNRCKNKRDTKEGISAGRSSVN